MRCILAGNKILARDHSPSVLILENLGIAARVRRCLFFWGADPVSHPTNPFGKLRRMFHE